MNQLLEFYGLAHHPFGRRTPKEAVHRHSGFDEALSCLQISVELETIPELVAEPGCGEKPLLENVALETVFDVSGGAPRSINGVAADAMIVAAARKQPAVSAQDVHDSHVDRGRP